ncbi:MAG TPA: hypothetical protein VL358_14215 [Caulobacteraceae bacterium]|jgi:hypothetical protein|nr:hypothetical protein [Caulobacteraceae bacterium]
MRFSATDAAFDGFRVTRRHPVAVLAWAAVMFAANIVSGLAVGVLAGPAWAQFETVATSAAPDPALTLQLMGKVAPAALVSMAIQVVGAAVVNASVLRALLRPQRRAVLGFGRDEARVIGLLALFVVVSMLSTVALSIVFGLLGGVLGPAALGLAPIASLAVLLVLTMRLSLAGPMTIAEHRFRFRESWPETKPWFWPLLGAEALAAALALVVVFLAHMVFVAATGAVVVGAGGALTDLAAMFSPDFSSVDKLMRPLSLLYLAFASVLYALVLIILIAPPVELYRHLHGGETDADPA